MPRKGPVRAFDWDEAARLRATGLSYVKIGAQLGVSARAVEFALNPEQRAKNYARVSAWQRSGTCPDCGGPATRHPGVQSRCRACDSTSKAKVKDGSAYCPTCDTWGPLDQFSRASRRPSRGVHSECRACSTARKREWRNKNRERQRAYDRSRSTASGTRKRGTNN